MKSKKVYIIIIIIIVVFAGSLFLLFGRENFIKRNNQAIVIIGNDAIWNYSGEYWLNLNNSKAKNKLSWQNFDVYIDNKMIGNYSLMFSDKWYIFDDKKKPIKKFGNLIAIQSNYDIPVNDFQVKDISNYSDVRDMLRKYKLDPYSKFTVSSQVSIDIDNDNRKEILYFVSNAFPLDFESSKTFSFVFMKKDGKIIPIFSNVLKGESINGCKPYLQAVLDIDSDNVNELVIACGGYSNSKPLSMLYKYGDGEFKILNSNQ